MYEDYQYMQNLTKNKLENIYLNSEIDEGYCPSYRKCQGIDNPQDHC